MGWVRVSIPQLHTHFLETERVEKLIHRKLWKEKLLTSIIYALFLVLLKV